MSPQKLWVYATGLAMLFGAAGSAVAWGVSSGKPMALVLGAILGAGLGIALAVENS